MGIYDNKFAGNLVGYNGKTTTACLESVEIISRGT